MIFNQAQITSFQPYSHYYYYPTFPVFNGQMDKANHTFMHYMLFLLAIYILISSSTPYGATAKQIPFIIQQWQGDFIAIPEAYQDQGIVIKGYVYTDYINNGGKAVYTWTNELTKTGIVVPSKETFGAVNIFGWINDIKRCVFWASNWAYNVKAYVPWHIPQNATYHGEEMVNGFLCDKWSFIQNGIYPDTNYTVWNTENTIVQVSTLGGVWYYWNLNFKLTVSNIILGPFDPSIYALPSFCPNVTDSKPLYSF